MRGQLAWPRSHSIARSTDELAQMIRAFVGSIVVNDRLGGGGSSLGRLSGVSPPGDRSTSAPHGWHSYLDFTMRNVLLCSSPPFFLLFCLQIHGRRSGPNRLKDKMMFSGHPWALCPSVPFWAHPLELSRLPVTQASQGLWPPPTCTTCASRSPSVLSSTWPDSPSLSSWLPSHFQDPSPRVN